MNPLVISYAIQLLGALPSLIEAGVAVRDLIDGSREKLAKMQEENRAPTDAEWDELNASIESKRKALHG